MPTVFSLSVVSMAIAALVQARVGSCPPGQHWDMEACQCFQDETCAAYVRCGYEQIADPRYECKCTHRDEVNALFAHNYDENCEKPRPVSAVVEDDDFVTGKYTCDDSGKKMWCEAEECPPGHEWDDESCMCFSMMKCYMMCPPGQDLDPRYGCKCVDQSVIDDLKMCAPDEPRVAVCFGGLHEQVTDKTCPKGQRYDMDSCKCFAEYQCEKWCGNGQKLDPTKMCSCIDAKSYDQILRKPDGYDEKCNTWVLEHELYQPEPPKPGCGLTIDDCPNRNFIVNKETCECECDLMCIATMTMDPKTCSCKPINFGGPATSIGYPPQIEPELEDVPCDADGNKICPKAQKCDRGEYYDDKACTCFPLMKCRIACPNGQNLDPRFSCKCVAQSVIDELYQCEPDEEDDPFGFSDLNSVFEQPKPVPVASQPYARPYPQQQSSWGNRPQSYNPYDSSSNYGQRSQYQLYGRRPYSGYSTGSYGNPYQQRQPYRPSYSASYGNTGYSSYQRPSYQSSYPRQAPRQAPRYPSSYIRSGYSSSQQPSYYGRQPRSNWW